MRAPRFWLAAIACALLLGAALGGPPPAAGPAPSVGQAAGPALSVGQAAGPAPAGPPASRPQAARDPGVQPDLFYDPPAFFDGLAALHARGLPPARAGVLIGGLVPHHNLAGELFSRFFIQLEARPPSTLILIGPNHELRGQKVITGRRGWATAFGVVRAHQELIDWLEQSDLAVVDDDSLEAEHSMGALMPYIRYHAPDAKVVPLVLHRSVTLAEMERLAAALAPRLSADTILVASVDFSHYLTRREAEAKDVITLKAIRDFDLPGLQLMGPDHLDSPGSLGVLMLAMRQLGAQGPVVEANTNSGILFGSDFAETTSYFTFTYWLAP